MSLSFVMFGDIVGRAGRRVVEQQLPAVREKYEPDLIIANAENSAGGSGLTTQQFDKICKYGVDAVTLGDHCFRQKDILPTLEKSDRIIRPANLSSGAVGSRWMRVRPEREQLPALYVVTLLGRVFMSNPLANDPFATIDQILKELPDTNPIVLVEMHCEATSEKIAMGHYLDGRVAAVVGTHTHIPTADAKILSKGTGYITDIGMTGPYDSVLGREKDKVLHHMTTGMMARYNVAEGDPRLCGVYVEVSDSGRAEKIERIEFCADMERPPFLPMPKF